MSTPRIPYDPAVRIAPAVGAFQVSVQPSRTDIMSINEEVEKLFQTKVLFVFTIAQIVCLPFVCATFPSWRTIRMSLNSDKFQPTRAKLAINFAGSNSSWTAALTPDSNASYMPQRTKGWICPNISPVARMPARSSLELGTR